ncbi:Crp/Fnr family transcriptional regulator [Acidovorax facilis]|uniref:Crp/Fnr family transcriptional regulator n=1 Tax=Acidovorax facilis TaxID=12917 RepID=UPI003CEC487C
MAHVVLITMGMLRKGRAERYDFGHMKKAMGVGVSGSGADLPLMRLMRLMPQSLRELAKARQFAAHDAVFQAGDPVCSIYLVAAGEVRLVRYSRSGSEVILQRSRQGFVAEASLDSRLYHCNAVASEPSDLLEFPADAFRTALHDSSDFRAAWQSQLSQELRKLRSQCERLSLHRAADRIAHYIHSEGVDGCVTLQQPRKAWAAELGLTHEALYRTLRRMQDEGLIQVDGNRIRALV